MGRDGLREAAETMRAVRDRCVWTQRIGHRELVPYLVEESAELVDAVENGTRSELREELGDLLWQVLFHAEIASRDPDDPFDIDDVAAGLTDKMVRRHPHVFAGETAETPEQVLELWNAAKAVEKRERRSVLDGIARGMPSLSLAQKLLSRAARVGVGTTEPESERVDALPAAGEARAAGEDLPVSERGVSPERAEKSAAGTAGQPAAEPRDERELGDRLLQLAAAASANGWDAERALRERLRVLEDEIRSAEAR